MHFIYIYICFDYLDSHGGIINLIPFSFPPLRLLVSLSIDVSLFSRALFSCPRAFFGVPSENECFPFFLSGKEGDDVTMDGFRERDVNFCPPALRNGTARI